MGEERIVSFTLAGQAFEYDEEKNRMNIQKHGISFRNAARVFFDFDRIEFYDDTHSDEEERYDTVGDTTAGIYLEESGNSMIGNVNQFIGKVNDILFVVYTERVRVDEDGKPIDVTRLISARQATSFERGFIMVNINNLTPAMLKELAFTKEELEELERSREMPITFDEDCPETTPERAIKFRRVNPPRRSKDAQMA